MSKGSWRRPMRVSREEYTERWAKVFNVRDNGATGDGETDDTDAIQGAIDELIASAGSGPMPQPDGHP